MQIRDIDCKGYDFDQRESRHLLGCRQRRAKEFRCPQEGYQNFVVISKKSGG